ncbi:ATP synthase regulation protein NCA2 [Colletotrichum graminicola]|uniref:ATP synthase regulation protein NCA2 n=1 Tax=Colletotrichum graminicola (strain M1.001 / M2 / FGSC 10212) TaxID=645133 RepID=E3Q9Y9_COLGM|nr:ATP synthase regulation protein NCA2 [Colletotrichum graminicola M1.001]EFQ27677.1 ATP synthase regulation protein NCA2 [Colletotrichum graminicola M1.001]WDK11651.1 ATP synthase regulation protein NCA2 [Colletotrichum graminicola]
MSVVADQVRRLDAQLDRIPLGLSLSQDDGELSAEEHGIFNSAAVDAFSSPRIDELLRIARALSTTSSSLSLLPSHRIHALLHQSKLAEWDFHAEQNEGAGRGHYQSEIEWLLISKATVQTYGIILNVLLDQIIPLSDEMWYWDEVLSSYTYSSLYTVQTSPLRLWALTKDVYRESKHRIQNLSQTPGELVESTRIGLSDRWKQFYGIVRDSIRDSSITTLQRKVLSPVALSRGEARRKLAHLRRLRDMIASGLGVLVDEGLTFGGDDDDDKSEAGVSSHDWKGVVERSVALMDMVLKEALVLESGVAEFEDKVFAGVEEDPELSIHIEDANAVEKPSVLARRLLNILDTGLPSHVAAAQMLVRDNGRPSRFIRYWLPATAALLSSTTILRLLANRRAEILGWIQDIGATMRDFWFNWVVEPTRKIVGTIRHDSSSEIAIMSRDSLKADRESLERMVVDFALDKPQFVGNGSSLSDAQIATIRAKVGEGDVTPVLRAFEKDLRSPFVGAVKGDLVRSLLIQVQKTKVDLEVAISGIDSLLKSQELVFGFVGLTPGVLVSIGIVQYLRGIFGARKGARHSHKAGKSIRVLRNIDRIFSEATPSQNNLLSYKDHGLLLCEVHVLRSLMQGVLPRDRQREFLEDLDDLANLKGIQVQVRALDRIRWAYARWLQ